MKLNPLYFTQIYWKWSKELNVRTETREVLEDYTEEKLHNLGFHNDFLDMTPKQKM